MVTEDDLKAFREMRRTLTSLDDRAIRLRESMTRITSNLSGMPSAHGGDKFAEYVAKLDDLERKRLDLYLAIEDKLIEVETAVSKLPSQQQTIIKLRYFDGKPWTVVSRQSHYSDKHCRRIAEAAIKNLEKCP